MTGQKQGAGTLDGCRGGRGGAMWASPPTGGLSRCVRVTSLPPALRATSLTEGVEGIPRLRTRRGDAPQGYLLRCVGIAPYGRSIEVRSCDISPSGASRHLPHRGRRRHSAPAGAAGRCTPRVLASLRGHRPLRKGSRKLLVSGCFHALAALSTAGRLLSRRPPLQ